MFVTTEQIPAKRYVLIFIKITDGHLHFGKIVQHITLKKAVVINRPLEEKQP